MLHSVGAPWLWNEGLEFGSGSSHGQGAVPQEELPKMLWSDSPESQSSSLSFSGASKGNTYIIKYRKLYESKNLNNPLLYIGCTSWLVMDGASPQHQKEASSSYSIPNSTNQNQRCPTYKWEGFFCPTVFLCQQPKMQQEPNVHEDSESLVMFTDLFYWVCLMSSSRVGQFPLLYGAKYRLDTFKYWFENFMGLC